MTIDTIVEYAGVILSLIYVILASKQIKWCWVAGGLGSALYVYLNFRYQLIYDGILQLYYVAVAIYGIVLWSRKDAGSNTTVVSNLAPNLLLLLLFGGSVLTIVLGFIAKEVLHQNTAYLDAGVTAFSFIATWMTARKYLENWLLWVVIDFSAAIMYYIKGLYPTAGLYIVFTVLAAYAYYEWRKEMKTTSLST